MGGKNTKVSPLGIPSLLLQLAECQIPHDRNTIYEIMEQIDIHLLNTKEINTHIKHLKESDGVYALLKVGKKLIEGKRVIFVHIRSS